VQRSHEATTAPDEGLRLEGSGEHDQPYARLDPQSLCPATEQAIARPIRDPVDLALWATRGLLGDEALETGPTRLVHVEECDDVPFPERVAGDVRDPSAQASDRTDRHVPWDERIRNAGEPTPMQMHVRSTHFGVEDMQQGFAGLEFRSREVLESNSFVGARENSGGHIRHAMEARC